MIRGIVLSLVVTVPASVIDRDTASSALPIYRHIIHRRTQDATPPRFMALQLETTKRAHITLKLQLRAINTEYAILKCTNRG